MAKAKAKKAGGAKKDVLVVASKVKEYVKGKGLMSSGDLAVAVSAKVYELLDGATKRAEQNGRKTVRPYDV